MAPTKRFLALASLALAGTVSAGANPAPAGEWFHRVIAAEQAVHEAPLEQRPNRLGHVYGNNVRRVHYGRVFVNHGRYAQPVLRFFYVP